MCLDVPTTAIHRLSRPKAGGAVEHDAIRRFTRCGSQLIELHPVHGVRVRAWHDGPASERFTQEEAVPAHELGPADERLFDLLKRPPPYSPTESNCQQFASYVVSGRWESRSVEALKSGLKLAALGVGLGLVIKAMTR